MRAKGSFLLVQLALWLTVVLLLVGCSAGHGSAPPTVPTADQTGLETRGGGSGTAADHNRHLWSYHLIWVDPSTNEFEVIALREASVHMNVLTWLENGPCTNCFKIAKIAPGPEQGTLSVDFEIRHPFSNLNLTAFDVRGIAMLNGSHTFPASGLTFSDRAMGDGEVVNADGYTTLYNPWTEGIGPPLQVYFKGKYGTAWPPYALLNGYKRFISDDPANTRNAFYAGDSVTVTYHIDMPDILFVFGYAVDACWAAPISKPVDDPMTDFGPDANCPEAWKIEVTDTPISTGLTDSGGQALLTIDVYDWQGKDDAHPVVVECAELFDGELEATWAEDGAGYTRYQAVVENSKLAPAGAYRCLVSKEAQENDPSKPWLDITAYQIHELAVVQGGKFEWAKTWGGSSYDEGYAVAVDGSGNAYVTGVFWDTVDFDPGPGVDNHASSGYEDVFLSKLDSSGSFEWARTWGGSEYDGGYSVAVDGSGNVYMTGYFRNTVDFDPGPAVDNHTSSGYNDVFLTKLDSSGSFEWAKTWGGSNWDWGLGVAVDGSGNVYVTGHFEGTVDFKPGPGVDSHKSNGTCDVFLSKFDSSGSFKWAKTWGGSGLDEGRGVAVDGSGNVYLTGVFAGTVDFDPGPGVDNHTSNGYDDVFLSKFDSSGSFQWSRTWGGGYGDSNSGVAVDGSGNVYMTGYFCLTVDFDPGPGVDYHASNGSEDVFLSKLDSSGSFKWAKTWGGSDEDWGRDVAVDGSGNVYITGYFEGIVDFDPGPGVDNRAPNGSEDVFLSKFGLSGSFKWAKTWGGSLCDYALAVAVDGSGNVYVMGDFRDIVDFDPGPGVDYRTSNGLKDVFLSKFAP